VDGAEREPTLTKVEFDLTKPPSREEAGLPAGKTTVMYERSDHAPFQVRVTLPEGKELAVEARVVGVDSLGSPDPRTGPPTTLDISLRPPNLEAGRDHLLAAATQFGFDTKAILEWYEDAKGERAVQAPPNVETPWLGTTLGYLRLEVQGRYRSPIDTPESDRTVVHYTLVWGLGASPGPS
jgi:hypothetical protein